MGTHKVKVLEVNVNDQGNGGVFSLIKTVVESKPDNLKIDIAALEPFDKKSNVNYLKKLGTDVYYVGYNGNKLKKQMVIYRNMIDLLKKNKYDVVHIHADVANKLLVSGLAAKKCGVPKIILHSHATGTDGNHRELKNKMHMICRKKLTNLGAEYAACSYAAAKWMFPNVPKSEIRLIKNGIDIKKYTYDPGMRKKTREELNIGSKDLLIGHVGRFMYQKNHEYVIKVFDAFQKEWKNKGYDGTPRLILVGDGERLRDIKESVKKKGLTDKVIFYGLSNRVNELMQAMDVFILPSFFEGLPIVGIEAQAAGLPVLFSDKITRESGFSKDVRFLSIDENSINIWADELFKIRDGYERKDTSVNLKKRGYSIDDTVKYLIGLYGADRENSKSAFKRLSDQEVKDELFRILSDFADYCDENGLKYSLCGGTLLGAVRHKDFIPWDDDVDVFLSRADYKRLHELVKKKPIGKNYRLESLQNGKLFLPFAKITDTSTKIKEKYYTNNKHLWIDIFPVDGMPTDKAKADRLLDEIIRLKRYIGWAMAKPGTGTTKLRAAARNIAMIIPKIRGAKYYARKISDLAQQNNYKESEYVGSAVWAISRGERFLKSQYENVQEVDFHGRKFHAPEYDDYLRGLYGDYMTPPPEKDRKTHSITVYKKK